jgi:hypothetical protein
MATNERSMLSRAPDDPYVGGVAINYGGGDQTLATSCRGIFVGGAGNLAVKMLDGNDVTFTGLAAGQVYRICATIIRQTGSSATNCVALL